VRCGCCDAACVVGRCCTSTVRATGRDPNRVHDHDIPERLLLRRLIRRRQEQTQVRIVPRCTLTYLYLSNNLLIKVTLSRQRDCRGTALSGLAVLAGVWLRTSQRRSAPKY